MELTVLSCGRRAAPYRVSRALLPPIETDSLVSGELSQSPGARERAPPYERAYSPSALLYAFKLAPRSALAESRDTRALDAT